MPYVSQRGMGDVSSTIGSLMPDVTQWDWHEWALAVIGGYVAVKWIVGGVKRRVVYPIKDNRRKSVLRAKKKKRLQGELAAL